MEYAFRRFDPSRPPPAPDEIHLREVNPQRPRELALRAVEQGLSAFVQGAGPIQRIVIQHDPTLDPIPALGGSVIGAALAEELLLPAEPGA